MANEILQSGDVTGFAPSHPEMPGGEGGMPNPNAKIPPMPKGKMPASVQPAPEPQAPEAQAPAAPAEEANPFEAAQGEQNPFSNDTATEANPFEEPAPSPPPMAPDTGQIKSVVDTNLKAHAAIQPANEMGINPVVPPNPAKTYYDALEAGWQTSFSGLGLRNKMPDTVLPEHADMMMRIASQIGALGGDLPAMALGAAEGAPGGPVGMAAGSFAMPMALKKVMMDHYEKGDITTPREFIARTMATSWEAIKGGTIGAATALTGGAVAPVAGKLAGMGAELATMTTVGSAMEGHLPSAQDFIDGAIVLGGLHGAVNIAPKLRNIYAATGERPEQIVAQAQTDVELKQQLLAGGADAPIQASPTELEHGHVKEAPAEGQPEKIVGTTTKLKTPEPTPLVKQTIERSPEEAAVLSHIGESEAPKKATTAERAAYLYQQQLDYLRPLKDINDKIHQEGKPISLYDKDNAYVMGRLFAAYKDTVNSIFEYGTRDGRTDKINGEGLHAIYNDIPNGDLDGYRAYGMAKRALELVDRADAEGNPTPITPWKDFNRAEAEKVVAAGEKKFEPILKRAVAFENRILDYAEAKGLFSTEKTAADGTNPEGMSQLDVIKAMNENHFPLNRVQDADPFTGKVKGATILKRIYGSERNVLDPVLQTYKNTEMIIKKAKINEVRNLAIENLKLDDLIATGVEGEDLTDKILTRVDQKMIPHAVGSEELASALKKQGINVSPNGIDFWRPEQTYLRDNQVAVMENGKRVIYEGSPLVIDTLKRLEGDRTPVDVWSKTLGFFSKATRLGVVLDPGFAVRHFFASQMMAGVYSKTGFIPFYHSALAMKDFMGKTSTYQDWLYHGGATASWLKLDENYLKDNVVEKSDKEAPFMGKAWNTVHKAAEAGEAFIKLTDNLSRLAEYKRAVEQGKSPTEAAFYSREVVADYQKVGVQRSILRTGVAFLGAHVNHLDQMYTAFEADPKGVLARLAVLSTMSAMLWAVNKDDPAYDALPDWQKNGYWNVNVSRFGGGKENEPATILKLRKPWAPGILFGSGVEVALDAFTKDKPQEAGHFAESLMKSVVPEPMPNILQPIMEQYSNKKSFTGAPLVPQDKEKLLPELQYEPYTSETAKAIARIIGYVPLVKNIGPNNDSLSSPLVVENYIHAWAGTAGGWALKLSDKLINEGQKAALHMSGKSEAEKAAELSRLSNDKVTPWEDQPFFHGFFSRYPSFSNENVRDFYENKNETDKAYNSIKYAAKQGDFDAAKRMMETHPDFQVRLDEIGKGIGTAKKAYQNIQDTPTLPAVQKRQLLDKILYDIGSMANMGNQMMSDFNKKIHENKGK